MPYANLKIGLTAAKAKALIAQISAIETAMPFLVQLTTKEKRSHLRMGKKAGTFFSLALELAKQNPDFLPNYFDMAGFSEDVKDYQFLSDALVQINKINAALADTVIALEQESMRASQDFYRHCQAAAKQNVVGAGEACSQLGAMMPKKGKGKKSE